jgi:hypothetical protein
VAFVLVVFFAHLPAARGPGPDQLNQARHLAAAAAAAAAGVAAVEAADPERPAFFLFRRALHPLALRQPEPRSADGIRVVRVREVGPARPRPSVPPCRTVSVGPDPVADFVEAHFAVEPAPHGVVAPVFDAALVAAAEHPLNPMVVLLSPLLLVHRTLEVAPLPDLGLGRVLAARARRLRAAPMAGLSRRDALGRSVCYLRRATATFVLRLPRAVPLCRGAAAHRACLFHAQPAALTRLTRVPVLHPALYDPLCRPEEVYSPDRDLPPPDLSLYRAPDCLPHERPHELAAEFSSDLRL